MLQSAQQAATQHNWSQVTQTLRQCSSRFERASAIEREQALALALDTLLWGDFQDRWEVAKVFPSLGQSALSALIELLLDDALAFEVRWFAARILGAFQDPETVEPLLHCLQTAADPDVSHGAALALASLGEIAIAPLATALQDPTTCPIAIQALTRIRHPGIIEPLLTMMDHADAAIRTQVIEALSNFQATSLIPVLITATQDIHANVRKEAITGLGLWATVQRDRVDLFEHIYPSLMDLKLEVCQQAAIALGRLGTPTAAEALFTVLQRETTPEPLKRDLIRALGQIESHQTLTYFQTVLPILELPHQVEAIRVLGQLSEGEFQQAAAQILLDFHGQLPRQFQSPPLLQELTQSWAHLQNSAAIPALEQLANSEVKTVQLHAIAALKHLQPSS